MARQFFQPLGHLSLESFDMFTERSFQFFEAPPGLVTDVVDGAFEMMHAVFDLSKQLGRSAAMSVMRRALLLAMFGMFACRSR